MSAWSRLLIDDAYNMNFSDDFSDLPIKDRKKNDGANMLVRDRKFRIPANIEWEVNGDRVAALRRCFACCQQILESPPGTADDSDRVPPSLPAPSRR